jgi:heme oxygenase
VHGSRLLDPAAGALQYPPMLADLLREGTRQLHRRAETTGFIVDMLRGVARREHYALYLRNLYPVYECLESALVRRRHEDGWKLLGMPSIHRSASIAADLDAICGRHWRWHLPVLSTGAAYRRRIDEIGDEPRGAALAAHAYTRFLGDLNGGALLMRRLASIAGIGPEALNFYRFSLDEELPAFRARYRLAFEDLGFDAADARQTLEEARHAFELNINLSEQLQAIAGGKAAATMA